jgi:hypothetical protein
MPNYEEKMFREKPYTQCFECIQGSRLKCKKCMLSLVESIIREREQAQGMHRRHQTHSGAHKAPKVQSQKAPEALEIKTGFGMWMDQVYFRRTQVRDPLRATIGGWPHKKAMDRTKMVKLQTPRFETWSGRLLARFSKSGEMASSLQKGLRMRG